MSGTFPGNLWVGPHLDSIITLPADQPQWTIGEFADILQGTTQGRKNKWLTWVFDYSRF